MTFESNLILAGPSKKTPSFWLEFLLAQGTAAMKASKLTDAQNAFIIKHGEDGRLAPRSVELIETRLTPGGLSDGKVNDRTFGSRALPCSQGSAVPDHFGEHLIASEPLVATSLRDNNTLPP